MTSHSAPPPDAPTPPPAPNGGRGGGLIAAAINRPVSVTVGVVLIVMFGFLSLVGIPIQLTPDITVPTITVSTVWPGASPVEIESDIIEPQEDVLKSLQGLDRMTSTIRRDQGSITLELEVGSSLEQGLVRVTNLLSQVGNYPIGAREPVVDTANASGSPLVVVTIQKKDRTSVEEYQTWVDELIMPRLTRIPGVSGVRLFGGREREIQIDFDPIATASRGLTVSQLANAVRTELSDRSGGDIELGKRRYTVRVAIKPDAPEDLEALVLTSSDDGTPVRLGDVATVTRGMRKKAMVGYADAKPTMAMLFYREAGSNVLEVTREVHATVAELQETYLAQEGLEMRIVSDQIEYIEGALDLLTQNLLLGGLLAVIVLFMFLRSLGAALVVAVSIPVSIVGTVLGMSLMGRTANIVSMAGMAFAVGMVLDNSIVVLENIDVWRRRVPNVKVAALQATREVWGAILASTATTAAVFIPIIGWTGEIGELLRDVAVALTVAVGMSFVVSVLVIPSFAAKFLRARKGLSAEDADAADREPGAGKRGRLGRQVHWLTSSTFRSLPFALIGVGGLSWLALTLVPPMDYLPQGSRDFVFGMIMPPPGYSVQELDHIAQDITGRIAEHTGVEKDGVPEIKRSFFFGSPDQVFMGAVAADSKRVDELVGFFWGLQGSIPDTFGFAAKAGLFGGLGGGRAVDIDLVGANLPQTIGFAGQLMGAIMQGMPGAQVRPIPGLDAGAPELRLEPRRDRAQVIGIRSDELGLLVDAYVDGAIIGELGREGEPKRDVVLRAAGVDIDSPEALAAAPVATVSGEVAPLSELVHFRETLGPSVIQHIERRRAITLQVTPPDGMVLEAAISQIRDDIVGDLRQAGRVPQGLAIEYSGTADKLETAKDRFGFVLLLAVIISYLLMAGLFEDFLAPIAILVSVPLAGLGGILGLLLVSETLGDQPLDMMTAVGFVILIGVVVNNAILVVDGALTRLRAGILLSDAVALSVQRRLRPIFMTALTSMAGLLPLVLFPGSGSELYRGVGAIVLGGLLLSTVLTLYMVPAMFASLWRMRGVK